MPISQSGPDAIKIFIKEKLVRDLSFLIGQKIVMWPFKPFLLVDFLSREATLGWIFLWDRVLVKLTRHCHIWRAKVGYLKFFSSISFKIRMFFSQIILFLFVCLKFEQPGNFSRLQLKCSETRKIMQKINYAITLSNFNWPFVERAA